MVSYKRTISLDGDDEGEKGLMKRKILEAAIVVCVIAAFFLESGFGKRPAESG